MYSPRVIQCHLQLASKFGAALSLWSFRFWTHHLTLEHCALMKNLGGGALTKTRGYLLVMKFGWYVRVNLAGRLAGWQATVAVTLQEPCRILQSLLVQTEAKMVLTSRWRRHKAYVLEVLGNYGVVPQKAVDITPFNADSSRKDLEILQWLNANRQEAGRTFLWLPLMPW